MLVRGVKNDYFGIVYCCEQSKQQTFINLKESDIFSFQNYHCQGVLSVLENTFQIHHFQGPVLTLGMVVLLKHCNCLIT